MIQNAFKLTVRICDARPTSRAISTTSALFAEPPRKKKRIDPAVQKLRVERKIRKLEREISKLQAEPRQFAPILEYQLTTSDIKDLSARPKHTFEEFGLTIESLRGARRLWSFYRQEQTNMERSSLRRLENVQNRALTLLKEIDADLYDETLTVDDTVLIPYTSTHVRAETGANPNYRPPDGYIKDITKKWMM